MDNYKERIRTFYSEDIKINYDDFFTFDETQKPGIKTLYDKINNETCILKLIYGINTVSNGLCLEQQTEQQTETEKEKEKEKELVQEQNNIIVTTMIPHILNLDFKRNIEIEILEKISFIIQEKNGFAMKCMPNLFSKNDIFINGMNFSGYAYIYYEKSLIMIPGYLITEYINEHIILDIKLNFINKKLVNTMEFDITIIDNFQDFFLIKFLNYEMNKHLFDYFIENTTSYEHKFIILVVYYYISQYTYFNNYINKKLRKETSRYNIEILKMIKNRKDINISPYLMLDLTETIEKYRFLQKYLKYKNKYFNIMNKINI
jgi:hypothetical protein